MRAFHMNLQVYNANTAYPDGGEATSKHDKLIKEMKKYSNKRPFGLSEKIVDIAGFTEVIVSNGAEPRNIKNALTDLGESLNIRNSNYHIAVIRCGRTALQSSNEVVGIVINGDATIQTFGLAYLRSETSGGPFRWVNREIPATDRYTFFNDDVTNDVILDYRHVVYAKFKLDDKTYTVGFIHNRRPGQHEGISTMQRLRALVGRKNLNIEGRKLELTMCGGDFNVVAPTEAEGKGRGVKVGHDGNRNQLWYYSPGKTTRSNPYDYWMSKKELEDPDLRDSFFDRTALSEKTPAEPDPAITGSDHRGVDIEIS